MSRSNNCPLPENTVFYRLFPAPAEAEDAGSDHDLTCLAVKCTELAKKLAGRHLWHYEPFTLGVCRHVTRSGMRGMCLFISCQPRDLESGGVLFALLANSTPESVCEY